MKYEFHVGDYVETKTNHIGYIAKIGEHNNGYSLIYICYTDDKTYPVSVKDERIEQDFVRIGQYDFTKKNEGKIELLACETVSDYSNEKLRKKINELVEAVNRLEEKVNEMA